MSNEGTILAFLAIWGFMIFLIFILGILLYVLSSIGLCKLASNQKIENPWLAWIPIGNMYILGKLVKNLKIDALEIPSLELVLPLGFVAVMLFKHIPVIGWLISIAYSVLCLLAFYKLYKMYRPEQAVLWVVLSIVLPFMGPIFIFMMRNDTPVSQ